MLRAKGWAIKHILAVFVGGCDNANHDPASVAFDSSAAIVDVAGAEVVRSRAVAGQEASVATSPHIRLGSIDGDSLIFGNVSGVAVDSVGNIYIADGVSLEVHAFSPVGQHLWSSGRSGSGPGEYQSVSSVEVCGDLVVVGDLAAMRLTAIDASGSIVGMREWPSLEEYSAPLAFSCGSDGTLSYLDWEFTLDPPSGPHVARAVVGVSTFAQERPAVVAVFPGFDRYGYGSNDAPAHFGASSFVAISGDGVRIMRGDEPAIYTFDIAGRLKRITHWEASRPQLTREVVEEELQRRLLLFPPARRPGYRSRWRDVIMPEFLPLAADLIASADGDLWVQQYVPPTATPTVRRWWVISESDTVLFTASVPGDFELHRVLTDEVVGVFRDSLGVQYVEKRQLNRPVG